MSGTIAVKTKAGDMQESVELSPRPLPDAAEPLSDHFDDGCGDPRKSSRPPSGAGGAPDDNPERTRTWNERSRRLIMYHDRTTHTSANRVWLAEARMLARRRTFQAG